MSHPDEILLPSTFVMRGGGSLSPRQWCQIAHAKHSQKTSFSVENPWSDFSLMMEPNLALSQSQTFGGQEEKDAARFFWSQNVEETGGGITLNLYPAILIGSIVTFFFLGTFLDVPVFNVSADIVSKIFLGEAFSSRIQDFIDSYARTDTRGIMNSVNRVDLGGVGQYQEHMGLRRGSGWESGVVVGY